MASLGLRGQALIKGFEVLVFKAYRHFNGEPWTCGWGHTGSDVTENTVCDLELAQHWFSQDTAAAVAQINNTIIVPLTQNQFDALVAFAFNVGVTAEGHSTLAKLVNSRQLALAANEFMKWDHVKGVKVAGLDHRRAAERALFLEA